MARTRETGNGGGRSGGMATDLLLVFAVIVLALPSAVLALSNRYESAGMLADSAIGAVEADSAPANSAGALAVRSLAHGLPFHFTPAGTPTRPDRSVTVAVRVDPQIARQITVQGRRPAVVAAAVQPASLQLAPSAFNLGVSRGYQSFAQQQLVPAVEVRRVEMPDLSTYQPAGVARPAPSRFAPRITLDERQATGRAPRTFSGDGEDRVDVGGSLRLTKNLDVTAGVRYSQERDRLKPLTDGKQDNQAVYVGTQFRF